MDITSELAQNIAKNARLSLTKEEIETYTKDMQAVLDAFEEIAKANTDGIEPSFHPIKLENHMRDDTPKFCLSNEEALSQTKHKHEGYFTGPKTL